MRSYAIGLILLVGCASTPQEVRNARIGETIERPGRLAAVAMCVSRGFDEKMRTANNLRLDDVGGRAEIVANDPGADLFSTQTGAIFVVDMLVVSGGVTLTYYVRGDVLNRNAMKRKIREIIEGC